MSTREGYGDYSYIVDETLNDVAEFVSDTEYYEILRESESEQTDEDSNT